MVVAERMGANRPRVSCNQQPSHADSAWFQAVYEETFDAAFRYALLVTHDRERAEDVVAEVYLRAWRARATLRRDASLLPWLQRATHNRAMDEFRARRPTVPIDSLPDLMEEPDEPALALPAAAPAQLQRAIETLTVEQQQVIVLRFFEGLPHEEIARRLGKNANAVRAAQFRALARLRTLLEENAHVA